MINLSSSHLSDDTTSIVIRGIAEYQHVMIWNRGDRGMASQAFGWGVRTLSCMFCRISHCGHWLQDQSLWLASEFSYGHLDEKNMVWHVQTSGKRIIFGLCAILWKLNIWLLNTFIKAVWREENMCSSGIWF